MLLIGQVFNVISLEIFSPSFLLYHSINALMLLYSYILSISDDSEKNAEFGCQLSGIFRNAKDKERWLKINVNHCFNFKEQRSFRSIYLLQCAKFVSVLRTITFKARCNFIFGNETNFRWQLTSMNENRFCPPHLSALPSTWFHNAHLSIFPLPREKRWTNFGSIETIYIAIRITPSNQFDLLGFENDTTIEIGL